MVAGLGVLLSRWTRPFAYVVAAWLVCIAVDLVAGRFFDIAVRDLVMAASAVTLARLLRPGPPALTPTCAAGTGAR